VDRGIVQAKLIAAYGAASARRKRRQELIAAMPDSSHDLNTVTSLITAEHARGLMIDLARVPSPLTELLEAEPKLREFIDIAVEPRLREMGLTDIHRDSMGNLLAICGRGTSGRSLMLVTNAMNQPAATMPNPYGGEVRDGTRMACRARSCSARA
jgi:hypothetical protein